MGDHHRTRRLPAAADTVGGCGGSGCACFWRWEAGGSVAVWLQLACVRCLCHRRNSVMVHLAGARWCRTPLPRLPHPPSAPCLPPTSTLQRPRRPGAQSCAACWMGRAGCFHADSPAGGDEAPALLGQCALHRWAGLCCCAACLWRSLPAVLPATALHACSPA